MILSLPDGYETRLGSGGGVLSGGQRQRVALARALYGKPAYVVLDEPNANLDSEGEAALRRTLDILKDWRTTVVIISHKPAVVASVDKLLVLADGQIEKFGPRAEVMGQMPRQVSGRGRVPDQTKQEGPHAKAT